MLLDAALLYVMQLFFIAMSVINSLTGIRLFLSSVEEKTDATYFFGAAIVYGVISMLIGMIALGSLP